MPVEDRQGSEGEFKPNLVNSCCYLVELSVQVGAFRQPLPNVNLGS